MEEILITLRGVKVDEGKGLGVQRDNKKLTARLFEGMAVVESFKSTEVTVLDGKSTCEATRARTRSLRPHLCEVRVLLSSEPCTNL